MQKFALFEFFYHIYYKTKQRRQKMLFFNSLSLISKAVSENVLIECCPGEILIYNGRYISVPMLDVAKEILHNPINKQNVFLELYLRRHKEANKIPDITKKFINTSNPYDVVDFIVIEMRYHQKYGSTGDFWEYVLNNFSDTPNGTPEYHQP